jgi:hypothetical protein
MRGKYQAIWKSVACPYCRAPVGRACFYEGPDWTGKIIRKGLSPHKARIKAWTDEKLQERMDKANSSDIHDYGYGVKR